MIPVFNVYSPGRVPRNRQSRVQPEIWDDSDSFDEELLNSSSESVSATEIPSHAASANELEHLHQQAPSFFEWENFLTHVKSKWKGLQPVDVPATLHHQLEDMKHFVGAHIGFRWNVGWSIGQVRCISRRRNCNCEVQYEGENVHRLHLLKAETYGTGDHASEGAWCLLQHMHDVGLHGNP